MKKYSKPTTYRGILFRSRLEADYAAWFDKHGLIWSYEPEGYQMKGDISYLPDFYLPLQNAWFEAKGVMLDQDILKIIGLAKESRRDVFVGSYVYNGVTSIHDICVRDDLLWRYQGNIWVAECKDCGSRWLALECEYGDWNPCPACGAWGGDHWNGRLLVNGMRKKREYAWKLMKRLDIEVVTA